MKLAIAGLGKMGSQMVEKLLTSGHEVIVDCHRPANTDPLVAKGAESFTDYQELAGRLGARPVIWLMIPHQQVPVEVEKLLKLWPAGGIIVDGGNSNFNNTMKLAEQARLRGVELVDVGTSGGIWGIKQGFAMMVGGNEDAVRRITPLLDTLAQPQATWYRFGEAGAGHYVKMIHNGVEYGIMQSFAEGYRLLKEGPIDNIDLGRVAEVWQHRSINESFLNGLIEQMLKRDPEFKGVAGVVAESGEARWTLETAREHDLPMPAIQTAFEVRLRSQQGEVHYGTRFLAQLRNEFGGHTINPDQES